MGINKIKTVCLDGELLDVEVKTKIVIPIGTHILSVNQSFKYGHQEEILSIIKFYLNLMDSSCAPIANDILKEYAVKKINYNFETDAEIELDLRCICFENFLENADCSNNINLVSKNIYFVYDNIHFKTIAFKYLAPILLFFVTLSVIVVSFSISLFVKGYREEAVIGVAIGFILLFLLKYLLFNSPPLHSWLEILTN